jgi:aspartate-semialdehyde dehydrogenase
MAPKRKVAIVGATGMAGQQFVEALDGHPWFEIVSMHGESAAGKTYGAGRRGFSAHNTSDEVLNMVVKKSDEVDLGEVEIVFSALPSDVAKKMEGTYAEQVPVISTASAYRYEPDVPIYLPIVNGESQTALIETQRQKRGWKGFVLPGPNCTTVGLAISLAPIYQKFGLKSIHMVSMQAISGGGYPGVPAYDITANVIPHINAEEGKVKKEVRKILGVLEGGAITEPKFLIDCKCNRVPTINGHMESVFIQTERSTSVEEIVAEMRAYKGDCSDLGLPNAPKHPIHVFDDFFRPQPRIDLQSPESGMVTMVGGVDVTEYENGFKYTVLSHNTELGAGRGGVLGAEYLVAKKVI